MGGIEGGFKRTNAKARCFLPFRVGQILRKAQWPRKAQWKGRVRTILVSFLLHIKVTEKYCVSPSNSTGYLFGVVRVSEFASCHV